MRSPRPSYGRVNRDYDPQGFVGLGRLGSLMGGQTHHKSYNLGIVLEKKCSYINRGVRIFRD